MSLTLQKTNAVPLHIPCSIVEWFSLLFCQTSSSNIQISPNDAESLKTLINDPLVWNQLQNLLQLVIRQGESINLNISSDSLLAKTVAKGFQNPETFFHVFNDQMNIEFNSANITEPLKDAEQSKNCVKITVPVTHSSDRKQIFSYYPVHTSLESINAFPNTDCSTKNHSQSANNNEITDIQPKTNNESILIDVNKLESINASLTGETVSQQSSTSTETKIKKMPNFQLPNAKEKQPYSATIKSTNPLIETLKISDVKIPESLGLIFDNKNLTINGIPQVAGEFPIPFQYFTSTNEIKSDVCLLIVNPNPQSLWQKNEPSIDLPFRKNHEDKKYLLQANYSLIGCSRRGRSHEHNGTFRDDDFFVSPVEDFNEWSIMIVCDGAGSAKYSREGSRIVVRKVGEILQDQLKTLIPKIDEALDTIKPLQYDEISQKVYEEINLLLNPLLQQAINAAIDDIELEAKRIQGEFKDFSTTLLIGINRQRPNQTFITSFWMGDGAIAVYSKDKIRLMGKPDGGQYAGQTSFLSRNFANNMNDRMRCGFYDNVEAVIIMTDGISDPKFETDNGLANLELWNDLWREIQPMLEEADADQKLLDWMHFFTPGHHDDRTIAIMKPKSNTTKGCSTDVSKLQDLVEPTVTTKITEETENKENLNNSLEHLVTTPNIETVEKIDETQQEVQIINSEISVKGDN